MKAFAIGEGRGKVSSTEEAKQQYLPGVLLCPRHSDQGVYNRD